MKTLLIGIAMVVAAPVLAQAPELSQPAQGGDAAAPAAPGGDSSAAPAPSGDTSSAPAADSSSGSSADASNLPVCSKSVTDKCIDKGAAAKSGHKRSMHKRKG